MSEITAKIQTLADENGFDREAISPIIEEWEGRELWWAVVKVEKCFDGKRLSVSCSTTKDRMDELNVCYIFNEDGTLRRIYR